MLKKAKKLVFKYRVYILRIFVLGLVADMFLIPRISDSVVVLLIIFWLINIKNFKIKPIQTLILAAIAYLISFVFQFFGKDVIMEKGASWFFVFLTIALIQKLIEEFSKNEKKV